jgi:uncharacterized protein (TIGR02611 family)
MRKSVSTFRKIIVALVGFPIVLLGIVLIPLPGPGILVSLLGLLILSLEFDWAKRHSDRVKALLRDIIEKARSKNRS